MDHQGCQSRKVNIIAVESEEFGGDGEEGIRRSTLKE